MNNSFSSAFVFVEIDNNQRKSVEMLSLIMPKMRYLVSDEIMNLKTTYDSVIISETRPTSRKKRWAVKQILTKSNISN